MFIDLMNLSFWPNLSKFQGLYAADLAACNAGQLHGRWIRNYLSKSFAPIEKPRNSKNSSESDVQKISI